MCSGCFLLSLKHPEPVQWLTGPSVSSCTGRCVLLFVCSQKAAGLNSNLIKFGASGTRFRQQSVSDFLGSLGCDLAFQGHRSNSGSLPLGGNQEAWSSRSFLYLC